MAVLRLSLAAYRLGRVIAVDGTCSVVVQATRGIVAGAVHATIELRALLIEFADSVVRSFPLVSLTVYVDDTSIEAVGSPLRVKEQVIAATAMFVSDIQATGMQFSPTKNAIMASHPGIARVVALAFPTLCASVVESAKSLGGAVANGKVRNARVATCRATAFRLRKPHFRPGLSRS